MEYNPDSNPYGNSRGGVWDLGNQTILAPLRDARWEIAPNNTLADGTEGFLQQMNMANPAPYNADGSLNPAGWGVKSTKSGAVKHIIGTIGVLGAAFGSYLWGPTGGVVAAEIPAGSEGLMTGSLNAAAAAEGTAATSGGVLTGSKTYMQAGKTAADIALKASAPTSAATVAGAALKTTAASAAGAAVNAFSPALVAAATAAAIANQANADQATADPAQVPSQTTATAAPLASNAMLLPVMVLAVLAFTYKVMHNHA